MNGKDAGLGTQLRSLAVEAEALEAKSNRQSLMLDRSMDLHNELTDWACNTDHADAAEEVTRILDKYATVARQDMPSAVVIPLALSRRA